MSDGSDENTTSTTNDANESEDAMSNKSSNSGRIVHLDLEHLEHRSSTKKIKACYHQIKARIKQEGTTSTSNTPLSPKRTLTSLSSSSVPVTPTTSEMKETATITIKRRPIPTLASLCQKAIAAKIERYPCQALGSLSESEWESIVLIRCQMTAPKSQQNHHSSSSSSSSSANHSRSTPAINDKTMSEIERCNGHFRASVRTDEWVWKDCVEYRFKLGGPSRPKLFNLPWDVLVRRLTSAGNDLLTLLRDDGHAAAAANNGNNEHEDRGGGGGGREEEQLLERTVRVLMDAPMSVPLLTATSIGKVVRKFVKHCHKLVPPGKSHRDCNVPDRFPDVWKERLIPTNSYMNMNGNMNGNGNGNGNMSSLLHQLETLLEIWKCIASNQGVTITTKSSTASTSTSISIDEYTGKGKKTSPEQHSADLKSIQSCHMWRDLHAALVEREAKMVLNHGKRMREIREGLEGERRKIGRTFTKQMVPGADRGDALMSREDKREAILSGKRGVRALTSSGGGSSSLGVLRGGNGKMKQLKNESTIATLRSKGSIKALSQKKGSVFGSSVACATGTRKAPFGSGGGIPQAFATNSSSSRMKRPRPGVGIVGSSTKRDVALGGGKVMKMPKRSPSARDAANYRRR